MRDHSHLDRTNPERRRASRHALGRGPLSICVGLLMIASSAVSWAQEVTLPLTDPLRQIYLRGVPKSLDDLRQMDAHQQRLVKQISAVTVSLEIGLTQGSGVLVSRDGYVLTAAHVAGAAGRDALVILSDGRRFQATTLGMYYDDDAALVKIDRPLPDSLDDQPLTWPFAEMASAADLAPGSWVLALGHPGGFQIDRQPVARFGRILVKSPSSLTTDCKLVGGDSGGPLFDMAGRVVGVHSRIGNELTKNIHVPVDAYRTNWTRMVRGDTWGNLQNVVGRAVIGVLCEEKSEQARITGIVPASPAERAGIQPGDLVTRFGEQRVSTFDDLQKYVGQHQPGDEVKLVVVRGEERLELTVVLASIPRK